MSILIWILRILIALGGALMLYMAVTIWLDPVTGAAPLGVGADGLLGEAMIRADLGAFFFVTGGLALLGAVLNSPALMTGPLLLIGLALAGRLATLAMTGESIPEMTQPMAVEGALVVLFGLGRFLLGMKKD